MTFSEIYQQYPCHREQLDELAGKFEYDGNYTRQAAEEKTADYMQKKHLLFIQGEFWK